MKLLIASDLHGSAFWTRKVLEQFDARGAEKLVLLGDLLYHGPRNDLPDEYAPKEVFATPTTCPRWRKAASSPLATSTSSTASGRATWPS